MTPKTAKRNARRRHLHTEGPKPRQPSNDDEQYDKQASRIPNPVVGIAGPVKGPFCDEQAADRDYRDLGGPSCDYDYGLVKVPPGAGH